MRRHSIVVRLSRTDRDKVHVTGRDRHVTNLQFIRNSSWLDHGVGQMLEQLARRGLYPSETAVDLAILAATVIAADTRISRQRDAQDSWTREIDLYLPVQNPELWTQNERLIVRILQFLTGDIWRISFRSRPTSVGELIDKTPQVFDAEFDKVCLFSGGLDSFIGAIDLLEQGEKPLFVSHYRDVSTKSQEICTKLLCDQFSYLSSNHVRANVSFTNDDMRASVTETTTRGRSFIFFALAVLAAEPMRGTTPIFVPENGFVSLNVPLDPLRLGAFSTRTTHPFYMSKWQELLNNLGIAAKLKNPYRFSTKGEMVCACANRSFLTRTHRETTSCSSIGKTRWQKLSPKHCGYCVPCLIRRAAIRLAGFEDETEYLVDDLRSPPLRLGRAESRDVRAFQMLYDRVNKKPDLAMLLIHKTGPFHDYSTSEISSYSNTFLRGINEVGDLVRSAHIVK